MQNTWGYSHHTNFFNGISHSGEFYFPSTCFRSEPRPHPSFSDPGRSQETKVWVCNIIAHFTVTRGAMMVNMEIFPDASKLVRNDPPMSLGRGDTLDSSNVIFSISVGAFKSYFILDTTCILCDSGRLPGACVWAVVLITGGGGRGRTAQQHRPNVTTVTACSGRHFPSRMWGN